MKTVLAVGVDDPAVEVPCLDGGGFIAERDAVFDLAVDCIRTVNTDPDGTARLGAVKGKTVLDSGIFGRTPYHKTAAGRGIVGTVGKSRTAVDGAAVAVSDVDAVGIEEGTAVSDSAVDRVIDADPVSAGTHAAAESFVRVVTCDHESVNDHVDRLLQIEAVCLDD